MLHELQQEMLQGIFTQDLTINARVATSEGMTAQQHIDIYRGSVLGIHTQALADVFSVCQRLVGEAFFDAMTRAYIGKHPATSPNLMDYGDDFSDFIDGFPPARSLPYLADVAALEWAWHRAFYARNPVPLDLQALAQVPAEQQGEIRFRLCPGGQLLHSAYPVAQIWEVNQDDFSGDPSIDLDRGEDFLLIWRDGFQVTIQGLNMAQWDLLNDVGQQMNLKELVARHPPDLLQGTIRSNWVTEFF